MNWFLFKTWFHRFPVECFECRAGKSFLLVVSSSSDVPHVLWVSFTSLLPVNPWCGWKSFEFLGNYRMWMVNSLKPTSHKPFLILGLMGPWALYLKTSTNTSNFTRPSGSWSVSCAVRRWVKILFASTESALRAAQLSTCVWWRAARPMLTTIWASTAGTWPGGRRLLQKLGVLSWTFQVSHCENGSFVKRCLCKNKQTAESQVEMMEMRSSIAGGDEPSSAQTQQTFLTSNSHCYWVFLLWNMDDERSGATADFVFDTDIWS